jgi:hypothetical protein
MSCIFTCQVVTLRALHLRHHSFPQTLCQRPGLEGNSRPDVSYWVCLLYSCRVFYGKQWAHYFYNGLFLSYSIQNRLQMQSEIKYPSILDCCWSLATLMDASYRLRLPNSRNEHSTAGLNPNVPVALGTG